MIAWAWFQDAVSRTLTCVSSSSCFFLDLGRFMPCGFCTLPAQSDWSGEDEITRFCSSFATLGRRASMKTSADCRFPSEPEPTYRGDGIPDESGA